MDPGWAAVLGALVGGLAVGAVTFLVESRRQTFERERAIAEDRATARAAARMMVRDFARFLEVTRTVTEEDPRVWTAALNPTPSVSDEDRRVVYRHLSDAELDAVFTAEQVVHRWTTLRAASGKPQESLRSDALELLRDDEDSVRGGQQALRRLGTTSPRGEARGEA